MQPSSLIFLVIVAIWVAYLIQHWVRRREHLATARSVDRFSEAMRVLERRSPLPATMLATPRPDAYAVKPAGERPEVVVKRASVSSPLRARSAVGGPQSPAHEVPPVELVPHRTFAQIVVRRVRGVLFLLSVVAVPVTFILAVAHILKWLSLGLAVTVLVLVLGWLRLAAIREQTARRARRAELRRIEALRSRTGGSPGAEARPATPTAEVDPDAWQPVPVPPPTYTLKDPAHRPEPAGDDLPQPVPIEVDDDEIELMAAPHRRRVAGG